MKQFNELGLAEPILRVVTSEGYTNPTPIQAEVIPTMLAGRDVVGIAQTGTGKTAAFVLPLLHRIANDRTRPQPKTCRALILAPTRELAAQIADSIRTYGRLVRHSATVVVGGAKPYPQIKAMARGIDIIVATPGRLEDHVRTGALRLDATSVVVLDEADQMMDLGFMPAIRRIMAKLQRDRQVLLLSATMPKQIRALANDFLKNPVEISVAPQSKPIERIEQKVFLTDGATKRQLLNDILKGSDARRTIVFTRTKRGADKVKTNLDKAGLSAVAIHGNKSQNQREKALAGFRSGRTKILVATDIAARGIDVDDISHVINYELPNIPEAYVHRIGRTARAGKSGIAISFCDNTERAFLRDIERLIGSAIVKETTGTASDWSPDARTDAKPKGNGNGNRSGRKAKPGQKRHSSSHKPWHKRAKKRERSQAQQVNA